MNNVLFRWATGDSDSSVYRTNLAVASLQRFFPEASYCVSYNGADFPKFCRAIQSYDNIIDFNNLILRKQTDKDWAFAFDVIGGAWWKWAPFNLNIKPIEVFIDTDVFFIRKPQTLVDWLNSPSNMIAGRDFMGNWIAQNVGDFKSRLRGYDGIVNVGIVGLKDNIWRNLFKKHADQLSLDSERSYHINEQGTSNLALYDLERATDFCITRIPIEIYSWWKPFTYETAETIHFIGTQKDSIEKYYSFFREICVCDDLSIYEAGFEFLQEVDEMNIPMNLGWYIDLCKLPMPKNLPDKDFRLISAIKQGIPSREEKSVF